MKQKQFINGEIKIDMCPYCGREEGYCRDICVIKRQYKKREDEQRTKKSKENSKNKEEEKGLP